MKHLILLIVLLNVNYAFTQGYKECIVKQHFDTLGSDTIIGLKEQYNSKQQLISQQYTGYRLTPYSWEGDRSIAYFYKDDVLIKEKTIYPVYDSIVNFYTYDSLKRISQVQVNEYFLNENDQQQEFVHEIFYFYKEGKISSRVNKNRRGDKMWQEKYIYFDGGYSIETRHNYLFRSVNRKTVSTFYTNNDGLVVKEIEYFKKKIWSIKLYFYDDQKRLIKTQLNDDMFIDNKHATISNYSYK